MFPIFSQLVELALPKKCICGEKFSEENGKICEECFVDIKFSSSQNSCKICSFPFEFSSSENLLCSECIDEEPYFSQLKYVFKYSDFTGEIIKKFKYSDATYLVKNLVNLLYFKAKNFDEKIDLIISVPITQKKLRKRKYNQSALLAKNLAQKMNIECENQFLLKMLETKVQAGLNKKERQKNLKGAFTVNKSFFERYKTKNILIVDDVYTTGSTINECAKTLLNQGFQGKIFAITLARVFKN
jgi:ComF family protein